MADIANSPSTGASTTWLTPPAILDALGVFDLDPCAPVEQPGWTRASTAYTEKDDGLAQPWAGTPNPARPKRGLFAASTRPGVSTTNPPTMCPRSCGRLEQPMSKIKPLHLRLNKDGAKIYDEDDRIVLKLPAEMMPRDFRVVPSGFKEPHLYIAYLPVFVTSYEIEGHPYMGPVQIGAPRD